MLKIGLVSQKYSENMREITKAKIKNVAKKGAKLVILQELHQSAYFCQVQNTNNFDLASDYENDLIFWSEVAKDNNIVLVTSLYEKRLEGLYHNTAIVYESDGSIAGKYRKMHIPDDPHFYEKFYFTPGDLGFRAIDTSVGKLGVLVCWDQWYPEAARLMALDGAQILIYPTAIGWLYENGVSDDSETMQDQLNAWLGVQRGHAIANCLPVVGVNRVGFEDVSLSGESSITQNEKKHFINNNETTKNGIDFWGNSFVYDAQGKELFRSNESEELEVVVAIDMKKCEQIRRWWPFLRDRRIEHYSNLTKRAIKE
ncbi:carbon-nitrogen hydrolase [Campylobacter sp. RM9334]|uniref:carbon-nitrogen hydrolase n=1 Tax=unclassified Campylobacter TaxID=2593542 RepID=UPI001BD94C24|nr:carbon-nitrogen hydrolase [Campylobacter sp. 2018MI01]MBT0882904.1 carbon-nitrogen hydrolase [Campylobacter sp. 2018MI13]MBT0883772.1 carbon-nitrogen hydrolase [Campylobacter sp. 2018MI10]MBZ7975279.1 carbon-nitrogen hydrolase [Campylobacter sp. RM12637]MBZ7993137.1 carbon-nitrogen hydrolase [Campylobacter sp. RM9333]MBZ8008188.1 carbon-nitrogen hydrolase [Campylobacter sp. RM9334]ULO03026.1 N-carbamoylputrescine amidohydrolase [Campylobacter sp. RM12651]